MDIVLINPGDRKQAYQSLGIDIAAIEPPFWIAVLAAYLRNKAYSVSIIDANAENISPQETAMRIKEINPSFTALIVYGSQPSASTQNMTAANAICDAVKEHSDSQVIMAGLHPSALPKKTLEECRTDFVIEGEGPLTLEKLLSHHKSGNRDYSQINSLWWKENGNIKHTPRQDNIKNLDDILPVAAWDLLPMEKYRAHNWHCFDDIENRQPYGAIYTSLGCPYSCTFCCINAPFGKSGIRYRSPQRVVEEIELLVTKYGIKNLKIIDELFVLKDSHYRKICELLIEKEFDLNIWCYARVDTVKEENLAIMKKAGIKWIALGIESANPDVRDGASKKMRVKDIKNIVTQIQDAGIRIIGNYIFGLPDDNFETMQETLDMAIELNCEFSNMYSAMAYPGSQLYSEAIANNLTLPKEWHGYSQHSFETTPLPTKHISAAEVLDFRDKAFHKLYSEDKYLTMLEEKFGIQVRRHIEKITETRLKRQLQVTKAEEASK